MRRTSVLGLPLLAFASIAAAGPPTARFNHFERNEPQTFTLAVPQGAFFEVHVVDTCDRFEVSYIAAKTAEPDRTRGIPATNVPWDCVTEATPRVVRVPHDPVFGGYIFTLKSPLKPTRMLKPKSSIDRADVEKRYAAEIAAGKTSDQALGAVGEVRLIADVSFIVVVEQAGWDIDFSGGFTTSWLTDPEFALEKRTIEGVEKQVAVRDRSAESTVKLGFGGFINVYHAVFPHVALSFGLGINTGSNVSFFVGPSWRIGNKANLTLGWNWGAVKRLPNGVEEEHPVTDANALNTLPTRNAGRFFVGISYSFLSPGDAFFKKPLAPAP